ncbi:hypothetical protein BV379_19425, partial [Rhodovulum sulfidophilum]
MVVQLALPMALFGMIVMLGAPLVIWVIGGRLDTIGTGSAVTALLLLFSMYAPLLALLGVMEAVRMADA